MEYTSIHVIHLFTQNNLTFFLNTSYYGLSIIYINIYIYICLLYLIFGLLFLFDIKKIKTLSNLKIFNKQGFVSITIVLSFLSLSGIPPFLGFVGKFLLFNFLYLTQKYVFIIAFSTLNFFSIYFYIQNLRFLINKSQPNFFLISGFTVFFNKSLVNTIVLINIINFFGIFYTEDIYYIFLNVLFFKNA